MNKLDVLVIGDVINDTIVRPFAPRIDDADTPSEIRHTPGGQGANQSAWMAYAGLQCALVARVGSADVQAQRARLQRAGVENALG